MDIDLKEKVDVLSDNFINSEAFRHTPSNYNPYDDLQKALEVYALPKDTKTLTSVLDKIAGHHNPNEVYQGATEGNAITMLTQFIQQGVVRDLIDTQPAKAAQLLTNTVLQQAEQIVNQNQINHELEIEN